MKKFFELTNKYIESMPKKERKKYGQFFTSMKTARFMAEMYNITEEEVLAEIENKDYIKYDLKMRKALDELKK